MKITIAVIAVLVGVAVALPRPEHIPILSETRTQDERGQFAVSYQTGNGISLTDHGSLKPNADRTDNVLVRQGSWAYVAPDGKTYTTSYTSDERGFIAQGDHLPRDSNSQ